MGLMVGRRGEATRIGSPPGNRTGAPERSVVAGGAEPVIGGGSKICGSNVRRFLHTLTITVGDKITRGSSRFAIAKLPNSKIALWYHFHCDFIVIYMHILSDYLNPR